MYGAVKSSGRLYNIQNCCYACLTELKLLNEHKNTFNYVFNRKYFFSNTCVIVSFSFSLLLPNSDNSPKSVSSDKVAFIDSQFTYSYNTTLHICNFPCFKIILLRPIKVDILLYGILCDLQILANMITFNHLKIGKHILINYVSPIDRSPIQRPISVSVWYVIVTNRSSTA